MGTVPTPTMLSIYGFSWLFLMLINGIVMWKYDVTFTLKAYGKFFYLMFRVVGFSFSVTALVTDIIKKFVGQPRPYWNAAHDEWKNGTSDQRDWNNANQSFISGHASEAWALAFLLSLYLYSSYAYSMKCHMTNQKIVIYSCSNPHSYFLSSLWYKLADVPLVSIGLIYIPCYFALYVSLTRIIDYKHTPADITAGAMLGCFVSYLAYLVYYNEMYDMFEYKRFAKVASVSPKDAIPQPQKLQEVPTELIA